MAKKDDKEIIESKPEETKLPVDLEAQIKARLEALKDEVTESAGQRIRIKNKMFTLPDGESSPGPMSVIVVDFAWFFAHYPGTYNPQNPQQPDCIATGREKADSGLLKPHPNSPHPYAENCAVCDKNQWGSGGPQRKACKNQRRLLVLSPEFKETDEPLILYVAPTSLRNFDKYVLDLARDGLIPQQVVTEVSFDPNSEYARLIFKMGGLHGRLQEVMTMQQKFEDQLFYVPASTPAGEERTAA